MRISLLLVTVVTLLVILGCQPSEAKKPEKKTTRSITDDDDDAEDPLRYQTITQCSACEDAISRIASKAKQTSLGTTVKSMHNTNKATQLKRTQLARATEVVETACEGEDRGRVLVQQCQNVLGEMEAELTDFVVAYLDPDQANDDVETKIAIAHGKEVMCKDFCKVKTDIKESFETATKGVQEEAQRKFRQRRGQTEVTFEGVMKEVMHLLANYWHLYGLLIIVVIVVTVTIRLRLHIKQTPLTEEERDQKSMMEQVDRLRAKLDQAGDNLTMDAARGIVEADGKSRIIPALAAANGVGSKKTQ